jgi:hypothetical protein
MYSVRSDPLPWERLRTKVQGPEATEEGQRRRSRRRSPRAREKEADTGFK